MFGRRLDLLAQRDHVDTKIVRVVLVNDAPHLAQNLAVGDHLAPMLEQQAQQRVFFYCEMKVGPRARYCALGKIYFNLTEGNHAVPTGRKCTTKEDAEAGEEFAAAEGFGEIVISAGIEGRDFFGLAVTHRKDEDRQLAPLPQAAKHLEPAHVREAEVEDDDLRWLRRDFIQAKCAGLGFAHTVTGRFQRETQESADLNFVVDDEDVGFGGVGGQGIVAGDHHGANSHGAKLGESFLDAAFDDVF